MQVLHLVEQLCLALNDDFRMYLPKILPSCIQVLSDAERCNDYTHVLDILQTIEVLGGWCSKSVKYSIQLCFGTTTSPFVLTVAGTLDEHMHLLLPALIRLFKVETSVDIRREAIKTLAKLIPRVQVLTLFLNLDFLCKIGCQTCFLCVLNFTGNQSCVHSCASSQASIRRVSEV